MTSRWVLPAAIALMVLVSCGDADDASPAAESTETAATESDATEPDASEPNAGQDETSAPATEAPDAGGSDEPAPDSPAITEMGSFTVDGTEFAVTFLNRCIPFDGEDSTDIDLQPVAQGQGGLLNLYGTAEQVEVSVQGQTVEEIGGSISFAADSFGDGTIHQSTIDGDRWSGSATLADALGSDSTVEVTWDVMIPAEMADCSL